MSFSVRTISILWLAAAIGVALSSESFCADEDHGHVDHPAESVDSGAHEAAAHGETHGDGVDYSKVPLIFEPSLFFWSLGLFLLFIFVAKQVAWAPLIRGLDARESRVNRALHNAEVARVDAEKLLADHAARMSQVHEEVKAIVAAARQQAEAEKARIIAEADAEAAALRNSAVAEIEAAHRQAIQELDAHIESQAATATDHLLDYSHSL